MPEVAARAHLQRLLPVIDEALRQAGVAARRRSAASPSINTPGLVGALLVGVSAAKMLALALGVPLVGVNHVEAHIYACRLAAGRDIFPCVGLVVSGGHTSLFHCRDAAATSSCSARTLDDAAGEAFDKVASLLGLGFPGGPAVEREAAGGDPTAFTLPALVPARGPARLQLQRPEDGRALRRARPGRRHGRRRRRRASGGADLAASFQQAVVDVLVAKSRQALRRTGLTRLAVGGGVAANRRLRGRTGERWRRGRGRAVHPAAGAVYRQRRDGGRGRREVAAGDFAPLVSTRYRPITGGGGGARQIAASGACKRPCPGRTRPARRLREPRYQCADFCASVAKACAHANSQLLPDLCYPHTVKAQVHSAAGPPRRYSCHEGTG